MPKITQKQIERVLRTADILINVSEHEARPFGYEDTKELSKLLKAISIVKKEIKKEISNRKDEMEMAKKEMRESKLLLREIGD